MSTPENTFRLSVHKPLPDTVYHMKNNNSYCAGIPDDWYSAAGADLWVEYKFITVPVHDVTMIDLAGGKKPTLTHLQQEWLISRHAEGRAVGVLVGCKAGGVWMPGVSWGTPLSAKQFREHMHSRPYLAELIRKLVS